MNNVFLQANIVGFIFAFVVIAISLLVFWAIIRGAVLSALRQYRAEAPRTRTELTE
ncbi:MULTISPECIES: hypothetical protein [unclassified Salinibacterium]|uniref:hypothetical protein n=1 Tax=unclassified Salinibacterium TaxID=2632331 RepID=UPI00143D33A6|nr:MULTISPECIES: hypothetical protein [unclassified Salinibacterium]